MVKCSLFLKVNLRTGESAGIENITEFADIFEIILKLVLGVGLHLTRK